MHSEDTDLGEFDVIRRFFRGVGADRSDVILGVGDDAALVRPPEDADLAMAIDTLVEGRHFLEGTDARSIGHRALAVNLSDLAAMGATPAFATLALTMPSADALWLGRFCTGFGELAHRHGVALIGGDTTAGPLTVSVQVTGFVARGTALRRCGARSGDLLAVTGTLGDAGAGLSLSADPCGRSGDAAARELVQRFEYPIPRVEFGAGARGIASAAMDLSDGLAADLPKLAGASGVGAEVEVERLPLSAALQSAASPQQAQAWALGAGDDYELLLAVPPERQHQLTALAGRLNLKLTVIGRLKPGNAVTWTLHGREISPPPGYQHFRRASTQITV